MASSLMPGNEKAEGLVTSPSGVGEHKGLSLSHTHTRLHTPGVYCPLGARHRVMGCEEGAFVWLG